MHGTTMIFLVDRPDLRRLRQLPRAADDRRARHGVSAPERAVVLVLPLGGIVLMLSWLREERAGARGLDGRTRRSRSGSSAPATARTTGFSRLHILSLSSLLGAINFIVTIHNMRTRGMTWMRMPVFVWTIEVYAILLVAVLPALSAGLDDAAARPQGLHALLPAGTGRRRGALPARVLVLRAPRGVHHGAARDGHGLRDPAGLLAQADLRLHGDRLLDALHRRSSRCSSGRTTCSRSGCRRRSTASSWSRR